MSPDDWREVEAAFHLAADAPPEVRERQLAERKPEIRAAVERLLSASSGELELMRRVEGAATLAIDPVIPGPWRLGRRIGEGGMGAVYLAVRADGKFEKTVAVKLVRWAMDAPEMRAHFERERQILARFEHPNIARVLDAGETADGLPYLVMEYVDGPDLCTYCRARNLALRERLGLFLKVAQAVEYVHRHSVLHLDLKPANVLIDAQGEPRLLDFGLSKLADPAAGSRNATVRMLTPAYASPEQFAGNAAGVSTDVYGLGAILFEMLAEEPAFAVAGLSAEAAGRVISQGLRDGPSARGGRWHRELRGDLDTIVKKAMRTDPAERYGTVAELAEDVARHLDGRAVAAREYTAVERAWKFAKRRRLGVAVAVAAAAVLAAGAAISQRARARAAREERIAATERRRADAFVEEAKSQKVVADTRLEGQLDSIAASLADLWVIHGLPASLEARRAGLLENEKAIVGVLANVPDNRRARYLLGEVRRQLGYLEARDVGGGLELDKGLAHLRSARDEFRRLARDYPGWTDAQAGIVEVALSLGFILVENSSSALPSLQAYDEGLAAAREILRREPHNQPVRDRLPSLLAGRLLARLRHDSGQVTAAEIAAARREAEWAVGRAPANDRNLMSLADIVSTQAEEAAKRGQTDEVLARSLEVLDLREKNLALTPLEASAMEGYILACNRLFLTYRGMEGVASANAERYAQKMKDVAERMAADPKDHKGQFNLAMGLVRLGETHFARGSREAGLAEEERGNAILQAEVGPTANGAWKRQYSNFASVLGDMYRELGRGEDAHRAYATALTEAEASLATGGSSVNGQRLKARALIGLARCATGEAAAGLAARAVAVAQETDGGKANPASRASLAQILGQAALVLAGTGDSTQAARLAESSAGLSSGLAESALGEWALAEREAVARLAGRRP